MARAGHAVFLLWVILMLGGCASSGRSRQGGSIEGLKTPSAMRLIPGGTFLMGSEGQDIACSGCSWGEQPVHSVTVSSFYMDTFEVNQGDYYALLKRNPSNFHDNYLKPVEMVSWFDAVLYCNARSRRDGFDTVYSYDAVFGVYGMGTTRMAGFKTEMSRNGYRLPTEAEWEYACRAGTATEYPWGKDYLTLSASDTMTIDSNAVWYHNSSLGTMPCGTKKPNAWGLYDMTGNVWEWCQDYNGTYSNEAQTDPAGPDTANSRILRGGSWCDHIDSYNFRFLRSAFRSSDFPDSRTSYRGFRCVRRP